METPASSKWRRLPAVAVVGGVLLAGLTACGSSAHEGTGRPPATGPSESASGPASPGDQTSVAPSNGNEPGTVLSDKTQVKQALPDQHAMGGWRGVDGYVTTADGHLGCPDPQNCKGKLFGFDKFGLEDGVYANFEITTFGSRQDAKDELTHEFTKTAKYPALSMPVFGDESRAYEKSGGGLLGGYITMRVGTVVATVFVEGGDHGFDPTLQQVTTMFVKRIRQEEAGQPADATLPRE